MRVLLDTNIVIADLQSTRSNHLEVRDALKTLVAGGWELCICAQVIYEFWVHATRPRDDELAGLGLEPGEASGHVDRLLAACTLIPEPEHLLRRWRGFCVEHQVRGKRAHDARLAAFMMESGVRTILTANTRHFAGWGGIEPLSAADV